MAAEDRVELCRSSQHDIQVIFDGRALSSAG